MNEAYRDYKLLTRDGKHLKGVGYFWNLERIFDYQKSELKDMARYLSLKATKHD